MRRLLAIALVWLGCGLAWMILGSSLMIRSGEMSSSIGEEVHALWGPPVEQLPPAVAREPGSSATDPGVELDGSDLSVRLDLEHRQKGLLWFPTYEVAFRGTYTFVNTGSSEREAKLEFPLQHRHAVYTALDVTENGQRLPGVAIADGAARWKAKLAPGERRSYVVSYRSRGTSRWSYAATAGAGETRNFALSVATNFPDVDFSTGSLSPTRHARTDDGWTGRWTSPRLIAGAPIGIELPQRLNPGPLAARITFFAPIGLLFYFFVVTVLAAARNRPLHPLNYFFFGAAFFAFHLLFAYLVDHLPLAASFALAAVTSLGLVVSYARLVVGWERAFQEIGAAQLVYLVLFSVSFFWAGFTGLTITLGAIITLAVMMQFTARRGIGTTSDAPLRTLACPTPYRCAEAARAHDGAEFRLDMGAARSEIAADG